MEELLTLFNPEQGKKVRSAINTLFAIFILVQQYWNELIDEGIVGNITKVYAFAIALIALLTYKTNVGSAAGIGHDENGNIEVAP